jgi:hypothetical protein
MQTADTTRTPTYTLFPKPDYFFSTSGPNVSVNGRFAYNHGYYSPNIDIIWSSVVGPGVAKHGVDGPDPTGGNESHDPNSTHTVPEASKVGTWVEEADMRPTMLHLTGLHDDYRSDGRVISQILTHRTGALAETESLAAAYQQLNSSVGAFATDTLIADSAALASGSATDDSAYQREQRRLGELASARDVLAGAMKLQLSRAADGCAPNHGVIALETALAHVLLFQANRLAGQR